MEPNIIHESWRPGERPNGMLERWYRNAGLHRKGAPAIVYDPERSFDGRRESWYQYDRLHRDDGPAVVYAPGCGFDGLLESWYKNGVPHRVGGPAEVYDAGRRHDGLFERWFVNGRWVRDVHINDDEVMLRIGIALWGDARDKARSDPPEKRAGNAKKRVLDLLPRRALVLLRSMIEDQQVLTLASGATLPR